MSYGAMLDIILRYPDTLLSRDSIIDMFVQAPLMTIEEASSKKMIRPGKLVQFKNKVLVGDNTNGIIEFIDTDIAVGYKLDIYDTFELKTGMIANYTDTKSIRTTFGLFILNYNILANIFGAVIPYINEPWNISKIEKRIASELVKGTIQPDQIYRYIDAMYHISSYSDFCTPSLTEKAITADPEVSKLRDELHAKYKDQLHDPNIMMMIDDTLIALDKKKLEGDDSNGFMIEGKNYNVHRKRMFLNLGLIESFGDEVASFSFSKTNLNDGWIPEELDSLANDTRRGVYNRAMNTAKGGVESKYLGRTFQESVISEDDCNTKRGLAMTLTKDNYHRFIYRNIIVGNKIVALDESNIESYIDKDVVIRSPMYCNAKNGYCYTCMDTRFKDIGIKLLNTIPAGIGSVFLSVSLRSMHGKKIELLSIDDINEFII